MKVFGTCLLALIICALVFIGAFNIGVEKEREAHAADDPCPIVK